jgi:hypothetical protein
VEIYDPWDWVYFQAFPFCEQAKNLSETDANPIFHGIEHKNPSFEKNLLQKHEKSPFGEDLVQDQIPALPDL